MNEIFENLNYTEKKVIKIKYFYTISHVFLRNEWDIWKFELYRKKGNKD